MSNRNYLSLTERELSAYTLEDIIFYANSFTDHWKIKIYLEFAEINVVDQQDLYELAFDVAKDRGIVHWYDELLPKLTSCTAKEMKQKKEDLIVMRNNTAKQILRSEAQVLESKRVSSPENLRRAYYELARVYEAAGEYDKAIEALKEAFELSLVDFRPCLIHNMLCEMYILTDNIEELTEFLNKSKGERWMNEQQKSSLTARRIITYIHSIVRNENDSSIFQFFTEFDNDVFSNVHFIVPPIELCKMMAITLFSSFNFGDIRKCVKLFRGVSIQVEVKYHVMRMAICLQNGEFDEFFQLLKNLAPHIYNDYFLHNVCTSIVDSIVENVITNYVRSYSSVYFDEVQKTFKLPLQTIHEIILRMTQSPTYTIDMDLKMYVRTDRHRLLLCNFDSPDSSSTPPLLHVTSPVETEQAPPHKRRNTQT